MQTRGLIGALRDTLARDNNYPVSNNRNQGQLRGGWRFAPIPEIRAALQAKGLWDDEAY